MRTVNWYNPIYGVGMMEMITPCGDNCGVCPRFTANTYEELQKAAELWYRVGWRDEVVAPEAMKCAGCSGHSSCAYGLVDCIREHGVQKCNQCPEFPCDKIKKMLERTKRYEKRCGVLCSDEEFAILKQAFFEKESNLMKM